ncbi:ATP-binding cassette domain-containing protein [Streptococcaceae bacterium ESL0687]|nr:ATP-binding cassette domain-containing protein [Streptococcaceae bacterium ESL0687]
MIINGLRVKDLETDIFKNLSFDFKDPGLYGIIGPNGVGKSSLFTLINGEVKGYKGQVEVGKVSYIPTLDIFDKYLPAEAYINLLGKSEKIRFKENLSFLGGADFFKQKISKYSLGMKELFALTYILSLESECIILDELLDGLDEFKRLTAYRLVKRCSQEKLILFTSHNLSEVFDICDEVYLLGRSSLDEISSLEQAREAILS